MSGVQDGTCLHKSNYRFEAPCPVPCPAPGVSLGLAAVLRGYSHVEPIIGLNYGGGGDTQMVGSVANFSVCHSNL